MDIEGGFQEKEMWPELLEGNFRCRRYTRWVILRRVAPSRQCPLAVPRCISDHEEVTQSSDN